MSPEGRLPEKKILPPYEGKEVTARKYKTMPQLLGGALDDVDPENRPTALDFHGIGPDITEDDILDWVEKETGISHELILADKNSPDETLKKESGKSYELLNYAYQEAKNFLRNTLKYPDSQINKDPQSLSSKEELFSLLNKTKFGFSDKKEENVKGLGMSMLYCRLVKVTMATFETLKHDAKLLDSITKDFENALVSPVVSDKDTNAPLISLEDGAGENKFYAKKDSRITGTIETRPKKFRAAVLKFITRPESSAKTALKDGIASRITIEGNNAEKLLPILCDWLEKDMKVEHVDIKNQDYFPKDHAKKVRAELIKLFPPSTLSFSNDKANPTSMGDFQALKITGIIQIYDKENGGLAGKPLSPHARQFEIQLVHPDNENEKGKMHHSIYDVVKFVTARTRLDGGCPEDVFNEFVQDAHKESDISVKNIIRYLTKEADAPIVKKQKKNGKFSYISYSVYSRWNGFGWVDSSLFKEIDNAKK